MSSNSPQQESTSTLKEKWKAELDRLTRAIQCRGDAINDEEKKALMSLASSIIIAWVIRPKIAGQQQAALAKALAAVPEWESFEERNKRDCLSCTKCGGILYQVVTLSCGHSLCRSCVKGLEHCYKCRWSDRPVLQPDQLNTNVTIWTLVNKWWADEVKAVELRVEGNQCYRCQKYDQALEKFNKAVELAPEDFAALSNRSLCLLTIGKFEEALTDAESVIVLRPNWPTGHYRRAVAMKGLGFLEEALLSLLRCEMMGRSLNLQLTQEVAKALFDIVLSAVSEEKTRGVVDQRAAMAGNMSRATEEEDMIRNAPEQNTTISIEQKLENLIDLILPQLETTKTVFECDSIRKVDQPGKVEITDFECSICNCMMFQPVTTPCGHSYCLGCLKRSLDHKAVCPLCKFSLESYRAEQNQCLTEFLHYAMRTYLPQQYGERSRLHDKELEEFSSSNKIPIYYCTTAYPTVNCPLDVNVASYRLMINLCLESGSRQFGICDIIDNNTYAEYGTILEITQITRYPDGRFTAHTVGVRRFKVDRTSVLLRDGYPTATVEYLVDQPVDPSRVEEVRALHDRARLEVLSLINSANHRNQIQRFGVIPEVEPDWITLPNGPSWVWWFISIIPLTPQDKVKILSMTQIETRLRAVQRGVAFIYCHAIHNY